jgi:hypothetical protein
MNVAGTVSSQLPDQQPGCQLEHTSPPPQRLRLTSGAAFHQRPAPSDLNLMARRAVALCEATAATGEVVSRER